VIRRRTWRTQRPRSVKLVVACCVTSSSSSSCCCCCCCCCCSKSFSQVSRSVSLTCFKGHRFHTGQQQQLQQLQLQQLLPLLHRFPTGQNSYTAVCNQEGSWNLIDHCEGNNNLSSWFKPCQNILHHTSTQRSCVCNYCIIFILYYFYVCKIGSFLSYTSEINF